MSTSPTHDLFMRLPYVTADECITSVKIAHPYLLIV